MDFHVGILLGNEGSNLDKCRISSKRSTGLTKSKRHFLQTDCCCCSIGTEKHPDFSVLLNYDDDDDDYSQGSGQINQTFPALTKVKNFPTYLSDNDFRSSN